MSDTPAHPTAAHAPFHPASAGDRAAMEAMRGMMIAHKGRLRGAAGRPMFDDLMSRVAAPEGVTFEPGVVGGIAGWWCHPPRALPHAAICHLHGGWFNVGSAQAYRHLVGHIARAAGAAAFIPDYRLAPEHPYPAAVQDAQACYAGLVTSGYRQIAVTGDSAGGTLALLLLLKLRDQAVLSTPVGAVLLSPITDLTLTGPSWTERAEADPYFTQPQARELISAWIGERNPFDPAISPLFADLHRLPPLQIHVGENEVLLDDSTRFAANASAAGVHVKLDPWEGMAHGFLSSIGKLDASAETLHILGTFLRGRLTIPAV